MNASGRLENWLPEQPGDVLELIAAEIRKVEKVRPSLRYRMRQLEETALDSDDTTP